MVHVYVRHIKRKKCVEGGKNPLVKGISHVTFSSDQTFGQISDSKIGDFEKSSF